MLLRPAAVAASLAVLLLAGTAQAATTTFRTASVANMAVSGPGVVVLPENFVRGVPAPFLLAAGQARKPIAVVEPEPAPASDDPIGGVYRSSLFASPEAVALAVATTSAGTRSYVGPAGGPLRRVAACSDQSPAQPLPVAVDGSRVAWVEGGCELEDRTLTPATVVVGGADPVVPVRRVPLPAGAAPRTLSIGPAGDRITYATRGAMGSDVTVAALGADAVSPLLVLGPGDDQAGLLGTGPDGSTFLAEESNLNYYDGCSDEVSRIAPGTPALADFTPAGCIAGQSESLTPGSLQTGFAFAPNRIVALTLAKGSTRRAPRLGITSVPLTGAPATTLVPLRGRRPQRLAADATRIAYTVEQCTPRGPVGQRVEVVLTDERRPLVPECGFRVRGTTLRRDSATSGSIVVSCPLGCAFETVATKTYEPGLSEFARTESATIAPGRSARVRVRLPARTRAGSRVSVLFAADRGPALVKRVRVGR